MPWYHLILPGFHKPSLFGYKNPCAVTGAAAAAYLKSFVRCRAHEAYFAHILSIGSQRPPTLSRLRITAT